MKKILLLTAILFLGSNLIFAQKDVEAKKILDKLSEKTKSHKVIKSDFEITFKSTKDDIQNTSKGTITMKGDMYLLKFMGSEAFFDGKTLWNYIPEVNEVNISEPEANDEDLFNNPKQLFTLYENDYKYQLIKTISENNGDYALVDLYPINLDEEYSRIRLQINTNEYYLSSATIFGKDGSNYAIKISNYIINLDLDDSYFVFDEKNYKDVEIVDLRW
ncbi:MAG: outer membrane lipoprotein carrier protein LolA [Bacteroidales bacterium]|jgi:outer membrane lipoprotein-sorting protein|nr:outer membrane lipoprotein carrier protein LolA [Bacteroidales bacterium]